MRSFKRPMFRKGGNVGTGIMTGIVDRTEAADGFPGPTVGHRGMPLEQDDQFKLESITRQPVAYGEAPDRETIMSELKETVGDYGGMDPLTSYLLAAGPKIASSTSFSDMISNLEDPNKMLIDQAGEKAKFNRGLRMEAYKRLKDEQQAYGDKKYDWEKQMSDDAYADDIFKRDYAIKKDDQQKLWKREDDLITQQTEIETNLINLKAKLDDERLSREIKAKIKAQISKEEHDLKLLREEYNLSNNPDKRINDTIDIIATKSVEDGTFENLDQATNNATWKFKKAGELRKKGYKIGSVLNAKNKKNIEKYAKIQGKAGNGGSVYYDDVEDKIYQLQGSQGEGFRFVEIDETMNMTSNSTSGGEESIVTGSEVKLTYDQAQKEAFQRNLQLIEEPPEGASRGWLMAQKRKNPGAITKQDLEEIIRKEKFQEMYKNIKPRKQQFQN